MIEVPVNEPLLSGNEKKYLLECLDTGWISSEGPFIRKFEEQFAKRVGRKFGVAICNGSAALELAVEAIGLKPGDEIIMPTFTIISCAAPVVRRGGIPVLVDSDPLTWNMDPHTIESRISSKTKAIMVVHIYGLPVDMDPILLLAKKFGLKIIEDAAEMHGQHYRGKPCGSFGELSIFSFYPNKHVTTGEGGMVVTDDETLASKCRSLRNLCFQEKRRFFHEDLGWNMRMTNLQAALGLAQLEKLDEFIHRKRSMGKFYLSALSNLKKVQLPLEKTDYAENIFWVFGLVLKESFPQETTRVTSRLAELGIGTRPFFWPMHEQPVFLKRGLFCGERYPQAERMARRGFYIPSGLGLNQEKMDRVVDCVEMVLQEN